MTQCIYGCDELVQRNKMKEHKLECANVMQTCKDCGVEIPNSEKIEDHDCMKSLMEKLEEIKLEKKKIQITHGLNYDEVNACCESGHQLKVHRGVIRGKYENNIRNNNEYDCKKCGEKILILHRLFYRCDECDYN